MCIYTTYVDESSAILKYRMNTCLGSGWAPVFKERNGKLRLIAMHVGYEKSTKCNCGVLISEVLKDIKGKKHSSSKICHMLNGTITS